MRILFCTPSLDPAFGGPARSVPHLASAVSEHGQEAGLWSPQPAPGLVSVASKPDSLRRLSGSFPEALTHFGPVELVHDNGLWSLFHHQVARACQARRISRVVSPRGMLEPWALGQKCWKKRVAGWVYQNRDLRSACCLHATGAMEVESIRAAGFRNPVALIPNGVEMPPSWAVRGSLALDVNSPVSTGDSPPTERRPPSSELRTALFLSRIHPKKGLFNLIEAWRQVSPSGWRLIIVGPDEGGHLAEVQRAVQSAGLERSVEFPGEAWGDARWRFYQNADLFVLPTFSENFGLAIAEALACGVPVITTRAAPWEELETKHCGWWIETGVEPLVTALKQALATSPDELHAMGGRGRNLVTETNSAMQAGRPSVGTGDIEHPWG